MSKHYCDPKVNCIYYLHDDPQVIYCESFVEGAVIHIAFANRSDARKYKSDYCRDDCDSCCIHRLLEDIKR